MSRLQLALNVADLPQAVAFYSALFAVQPHKLREGYANFEVADPPLKLALFAMPAEQRGTGTRAALNHLGVEVESTAEVGWATERLQAQGLATTEERNTTCCHAVQDKVWVHDPAGTPWEVYAVTDDLLGQTTTRVESAAGRESSETGAVADACCA